MTSDVTAAIQLVRTAAENPEAEFESFLQSAQIETDRETLLVVDFNFCEYWREEKNSIALTALFYARRDGVSIAVLRREQFDHCLKQLSQSMENLLQELPVTIFPLNGVIPLQPIAIPKPWGQEIWYTGIEKRGVAEVGELGRSVPLPWLLAVAPQRLVRGAQQPILLKILDPLPEPVFGDLYFELHRKKQEVYVVTAVDRSAWPDGVGAIRFGFDAKRRNEFADDVAFIEAYLSAVRDYRVVRKQIDAQIDKARHCENIGLNDPVSADTLARWLEEIDSELQKNEATLRARMESFTALMPLRVGDVVKVPCLLPHSLQHGVRTVEFQTPVYERLILSFAQKVLTQAEWDTDEAAEVLQLDPQPQTAFPVTARGEGWVEEQIVQFDDFEVRRICLQPRVQMHFDHQRSYALGMVVGQVLSLGGCDLRPDDAALLPACFQRRILSNDTDAVAYFLVALPLS